MLPFKKRLWHPLRFLGTIVLIIIIAVVSILGARLYQQKHRARLGVWWWSSSLGDEYLDFAQTNGVTEIYYCSSAFDDSTAAFIKQANARQMDVYWLAGEKEWITHPEKLTKQITRYQTYQDTYDAKFQGIHLDIEPQQLDDWHTNRQTRLTQYLQLVKNLADTYPDLWLEYDIQMSWNDVLDFNGASKPVYAHVIDLATRVTVMTYRDTATEIYKMGADEVQYAQQVGKPINLAVETKSNEGNHVSFQEEGRQAMYAEIAALRESLPADAGIAIHQIKHWYDLKD